MSALGDRRGCPDRLAAFRDAIKARAAAQQIGLALAEFAGGSEPLRGPRKEPPVRLELTTP